MLVPGCGKSQRSFTLYGTVSAAPPDFDPLSGARVSIAPQGASDLITDGNGNFSFAPLKGGTYTITVRRDGRHYLVETRGWMDRQTFLDGVALGQTMPGPLAAQVAMWVGYVRRRWVGGEHACRRGHQDRAEYRKIRSDTGHWKKPPCQPQDNLDL